MVIPVNVDKGVVWPGTVGVGWGVVSVVGEPGSVGFGDGGRGCVVGSAVIVTGDVVNDTGGGSGADVFGPLPGGSSGEVEFDIVN